MFLVDILQYVVHKSDRPHTHHSLGMLVHSSSHSTVLGLLHRCLQDNSVVVPNVCQQKRTLDMGDTSKNISTEKVISVIRLAVHIRMMTGPCSGTYH